MEMKMVKVSNDFAAFLRWAFKGKTSKVTLLFDYYLACLEKGRVVKLSDFSRNKEKSKEELPPAFAKASSSTFSAYQRELYQKGFIFEIRHPAGETKKFLIHPNALVYLARMNAERLEFEEEFKKELEMLTALWCKHFKDIVKESCVVPVEGWRSHVAYGNMIGWMYFLSDEIKGGKVTLLTPHLKLLTTPPWIEAFRDFQETYEVSYTLLCKESVLRTVKKLLDKKFTGANEFMALSSTTPFIERFRAAIFENIEGEPIFGFEAIKQVETEKYVGMLHYKSKYLRKLKTSLETYARWGCKSEE